MHGETLKINKTVIYTTQYRNLTPICHAFRISKKWSTIWKQCTPVKWRSYWTGKARL